MLSLRTIHDVGRALGYYAEEIEIDREEYYAGETEALGRWVGAGAPAAGFEGPVVPGSFEHLLGGAGLRRPAGDGAVAGIDLTFKAPKSVSVLWGIADAHTAEQLGAAHDAAVAAALGYMERQACRARRGAGGTIQVRGAGFVAAAFRHASSRAGDPLLHTHVVAGNLTLGPDGKWTALDSRHLFRHALTGGYLYQAELRREITERLGLTWRPVENGHADLDSVSRPIIQHFSQRSREMREHMAEHGGRSAESAQIAVLETRKAKNHIALGEHREQWRARAAEHGLASREVVRALRPVDHTLPLAQPVTPEVLTDKRSVFGRAELLQSLAAAQPQGSSTEQLERLADAMLGRSELVALGHGKVAAGLTEARYTTAELLALEQDLIQRAERGRRGSIAYAGSSRVDPALEGRTLSLEQEEVVRHVCGSGDGVSIVRASAGTGKTFVLDAAREAWEAGNVEVIGCALSARAALELTDQSAIPATTIAQLAGQLREGGRLPHGGVLVVDEAGMVGTRDLARLAEAAESSRTKLVLVGDDRQLPEIQAGGAFHALAERLDAHELREIRRQREAWDRHALDELRSGDVERWARAYRERGQITVGDSAPATRAALVNDWSRGTGDRLMIAARRADVADLNARARQLLRAEGRLPPDELVAAGRGFAVGDRVIGTRNDRRAGILNGQRGTVVTAQASAPHVDVVLDGGAKVRLDREYLDAGHLDHGYAITAHRAQGATVDRSYVLGGEELYREWGYTALSRHRQEARFYIARGELRDDLDLLPPSDPVVAGISQLLQRTEAKALAIDSLPNDQRADLERERAQLRDRLTEEPLPPRRLLHVEDQNLEQQLRTLENARWREQHLTEERGKLRWRDRGRRAEIDDLLENNREEQQRREAELRTAIGTRHRLDATDHGWLDAHGPEAERCLAVDEELRARDLANGRAAVRLNDLAREAPDLRLPTQDLHLDSSIDLGL